MRVVGRYNFISCLLIAKIWSRNYLFIIKISSLGEPGSNKVLFQVVQETINVQVIEERALFGFKISIQKGN